MKINSLIFFFFRQLGHAWIERGYIRWCNSEIYFFPLQDLIRCCLSKMFSLWPNTLLMLKINVRMGLEELSRLFPRVSVSYSSFGTFKFFWRNLDMPRHLHLPFIYFLSESCKRYMFLSVQLA